MTFRDSTSPQAFVFYYNYQLDFMSLTKFNPRTAVLLLFILLTATIRVIFNFSDHISALANFSPVGAMALFGGTYFRSTWKAFALPLFVLILSDVILHQTVFKPYANGILYSGWYWVYGAFALMTVAGRWLLKKITLNHFMVSVVTCVFIHWIVTDLGIWIGSTKYSQDLNGFIACLVNAIPYEWRFGAGTFVYGAILFGSFEWMKRKYGILKTVQTTE